MRLISNSNETDTFFYQYYFPSNSGKQDSMSVDILRFKRNEQDVVQAYCREMKKCFGNLLCDYSLSHDSVLCIMPSHEMDKWSDGLNTLAKAIAQKYEMVYYKQLIRRKATITKLSNGGSRDVSHLMESIQISHEISIADKTVIVFDDVRTTGSSFEAAKRVLLNEGAIRVVFIALGQTATREEIKNFPNSKDITWHYRKLTEEKIVEMQKQESESKSFHEEETIQLCVADSPAAESVLLKNTDRKPNSISVRVVPKLVEEGSYSKNNASVKSDDKYRETKRKISKAVNEGIGRLKKFFSEI